MHVQCHTACSFAEVPYEGRQTAVSRHSQVEAVVIGNEVNRKTQVTEPSRAPHLQEDQRMNLSSADTLGLDDVPCCQRLGNLSHES